MNQSIIFPDQQHWDAAEQAVAFPVQLNGASLTCFIHLMRLNQLSGAQWQAEQVEQILETFEQYRFDIEDLAESALEAELEDEQGRVYLA